MACIATRLMSSGAGKSGNPCERFTAPYFIASRVISRITDSVNRLALREMRREIEGAGVVIELATDSHGYTQIRNRECSLGNGLFHLFLSVSIRVHLWFSSAVVLSTAQESSARPAPANRWAPGGCNSHKQELLPCSFPSSRKQHRVVD